MFRRSFPLFVHKVGVTDQQLLTFLHEKGVMAEKMKVVRDAEFKSLLKADPNTDYAAARARLERIMSTTGDEHSDALPASVQSLTSFMQARPIWRKHIHPAVVQYPVQRVQRSGLCYIHAPEVVQHYAVSIHTKENAGMINMAAMIRDTWSGKELTHHIFDNRGGNALVMLQHILIPGSATFASDPEFYSDRLQQFGPALVTTFKVYKEFRSTNTS